MSVRVPAAALCALIAIPGFASAGPISFGLGAGNLTTSDGAPALGMALVPIQTPGPVYDLDPARSTPVTLAVVGYEPWRIPTPAPRDVHPDGSTHWNNDGYFGVDVGLTDFGSGETATLHFTGRAHMYNSYTTANGWTGVTEFWFLDVQRATLGGREYTVWGANPFTSGPAQVSVWVGPNPPAPAWAAPEPGTFALAALGVAPLALRLRRRS